VDEIELVAGEAVEIFLFQVVGAGTAGILQLEEGSVNKFGE
jgi:hypothetical protein